jgi:hypothetical protein
VTQFSLFGAEAAAPTLDDLDGLLLAGAQWVRSGDGARLSVLVADRWRARALDAAFRERGVAADGAVDGTANGTANGTADGIKEVGSRFAARTGFTPGLLPAASRWTRGARLGVPSGFQLGAGGLRLWTIAAGRRDDAGYLLGTPAADPVSADTALHQAAGAQLAHLGVAAVALTQRPGPGWRITSARRLRRFAELVGAAPPGAEADWP